MYLFVVDNLLKVDRILKLNEQNFCPASDDGMATIDVNDKNLKALDSAQISFILELQKGDTVPTCIKLKTHPLFDELLPWYVPLYYKDDTTYDVEYKVNNKLKYKDDLSLSDLEKGIQKGIKVVRIHSERGLTTRFLEKHGMRLVKRDKFHFAVPKKK